MSKLSKWLRVSLERASRFFLPTGKIVCIEDIAPKLKKIVLRGDFTHLPFTPGLVVKCRIGKLQFRQFTLSRFDKASGSCELLIYLQNDSKAAAWVTGLKSGDQLRLFGWAARLRYQPDFTGHVAFGDETSIGLLQSIGEQALRQSQPFLCLVELDKMHHSWPELLQFGEVMIVEKSMEYPAKEAIEKIVLPGAAFRQRWAGAAFYLSGRSGSIQAVKKTLLSLGISPRNIQAQSYWKDPRVSV